MLGVHEHTAQLDPWASKLVSSVLIVFRDNITANRWYNKQQKLLYPEAIGDITGTPSILWRLFVGSHTPISVKLRLLDSLCGNWKSMSISFISAS